MSEAWKSEEPCDLDCYMIEQWNAGYIASIPLKYSYSAPFAP